MFFIGDIGNTEIKLCIVNSNFKVKKKLTINTKKILNNSDKKNLKFFKSLKNNYKFCLFSSVGPKVYKIFKKNFKKLKIEIKEMKQINIENFINIKVNKKQIGSDRIANAIGANNNKNNFIIIDLGTATTFDVLIKKNYQGGIIAPGVKLSLMNLVKNASLIPYLELKKTNKVIGKNTINAVRSGFYWGYIGLIKNMINLIKTETKKNFIIIITGGYSKLFYNHLGNKVIYDKDITIKGLLKILNKEFK